MAKETIAINASIFGSQPTGLGLYTANLVEAIDQFRDDVDVYVSKPDGIRLARGRVRRVFPVVQPERNPAGHVLRLLWLQTVFPARLLLSRPRIVLNTVPEGVLRPVVPQVTVVHDLLPLFYPDDYPRQQQYFRRLVPAVLRASCAVIADSENTRRDIVERYHIPSDKVWVVPAGYDERVFSPGPAVVDETRADPYVLFVGNLLPHKNLLRLLDALAILARRVHARLMIRGDGQPRHVREIQERVETLGLASRVEFVPYTTPSELCRLYRRARVFVLPSRYEGFGLTALEAMACGTPVVAGNVASVPEVVGDAAILVDPEDTVELSEALYRVFTDGELRRELRARGLRRAARFSWKRTAAEVLRILDDVTTTTRRC